MRLPPIPPENLSPPLREVHDGIAQLVSRSQEHIVMMDREGALIGPFPALLHFPRFGIPAALFQRAIDTEARLPNRVRQVAILTVGAAFGARYELYAHEITGLHSGLSTAQIAVLASGGRPGDLGDEESVAHEVARCLTSGRILPTSTYEWAVGVLGEDGVGELAYLVGGYCLVSVLLNCFDVPVPGVDS